MTWAKDLDPSDDDGDVLSPSALDPQTHAEIQLLYRESTETLRFVKGHQWKTVGATLLTYLGIVFIAGFINAGPAADPEIHGYFYYFMLRGHFYTDHLSVLDAQRDYKN